MITIYIKGKEGFHEAILRKLGHSWLNGNSEIAQGLIMFWLTDHSQLRDFKLALGSKLIFKYRLQFITNLEQHLQSESDKSHSGFSLAERKLISDMISAERMSHDGRTKPKVLKNNELIG